MQPGQNFPSRRRRKKRTHQALHKKWTNLQGQSELSKDDLVLVVGHKLTRGKMRRLRWRKLCMTTRCARRKAAIAAIPDAGFAATRSRPRRASSRDVGLLAAVDRLPVMRMKLGGSSASRSTRRSTTSTLSETLDLLCEGQKPGAPERAAGRRALSRPRTARRQTRAATRPTPRAGPLARSTSTNRRRRRLLARGVPRRSRAARCGRYGSRLHRDDRAPRASFDELMICQACRRRAARPRRRIVERLSSSSPPGPRC